MLIKEETRRERWFELDSMRGLASLTVFFSHAVGMLTLTGTSRNVLYDSPLHLFWDGTAAVMLFFVLSGFVLALPYTGEGARSIDAGGFTMRRIFRIFPAWFFAIAFCLLLRQWLFVPGGLHGLSAFIDGFWEWPDSSLTLGVLLKNVMLIGPWFNPGQIDPVVWTLIVEMRMSLIFPFLLLVIREIRSAKAAVMITLAAAALYWLTKKELIEYVPMFFAGGFLAQFRHQLIPFARRLRTPAVAVITLVSLLLYTGRYVLGWMNLTYYVYGYITALGVLPLVVLAVSRPGWKRVLNVPFFRWLGELSYSIYLFHFPVLLVVTSQLWPRTGSLLLCWGISLILTLGISHGVYFGLEKPMIRLGRPVSKWTEKVWSGVVSVAAAAGRQLLDKLTHEPADVRQEMPCTRQQSE